jgi:L-serine dehydratase
MQESDIKTPGLLPDVFPSIFNDVIGPVMRGPSSSHNAAALRIGKIARAIMDNSITNVIVAFDKSGSLPFTHTTQGSDMGLAGGLLGFEADDHRLLFYEEELGNAGIVVQYRIDDFGDPHPNTYRVTLENSTETHSLIAISVGGGMIEIVDIDGAEVSITGDLFVTLVYYDRDAKPALEKFEPFCSSSSLKIRSHSSFVEIPSHKAPLEEDIDAMAAMAGVQYVRCIRPVLPIHRPRHLKVPFQTPTEMAAFARKKEFNLDALALLYESQRGDITEETVLRRMVEIVQVLRSSIKMGLEGTDYKDRILGYQSGAYLEESKRGRLMDLGVMNLVIPYVASLMEVKSALGVIVAAPTAGSCGCLPGAVLGAADVMGKNDEPVARALLAAGMIGVFITRLSTFAAEVGGCQVECGAGSAMAAAGLTTLMGGTTDMALCAASMALQNSLGMICDPVANRVEVPCLGKNTMAAANAVTCANMAMARFDPIIPLEQVIQTMDRVGKSLPHELRCTALGGLSITPAAKAIERNLSLRGQNTREQNHRCRKH